MISENDTPDRQIWSVAADGGLKPAEVGTFTTPLIRTTDTVAAVGTGLAARLLAAMRKRFTIVRADPPHPAFADIPPEADEYLSFSAGYGEVWSARELRQLVRRADRSFVPDEDRWHDGDIVVDPYRPDLRYPARSDQEFDLLHERHMNAVRSTFRRCSTLIVALGASEICEAIADGAVVPARAGGESRGFDPERHVFRTLSVAETVADLNDAIKGLRAFNPGMAIILMISPEPLAATAMPAHVVAASAYGKAVLRVAMEDVAGRPGISYFPALELAGIPGTAIFGADARTLTNKAINLIGSALIEACEGGSIERIAPERPQPEASVAEEAAAETEVAEQPEPAVSAADDPLAARAERRAARLQAEAAARLAAETAAGNASPPKRAVATVVDSYTGTIPVNAKGMKPKARKPRAGAADDAQLSYAFEPNADEKQRQKEQDRKERWERRTAREALQAQRKNAPSDAAATKGGRSPAAASDEERARKQRRKGADTKPPRQGKQRAATPSSETLPASEEQRIGSRRKNVRASTDESDIKGPRNQRRANTAPGTAMAVETETPAATVESAEGTRQEKRKRRNAADEPAK